MSVNIMSEVFKIKFKKPLLKFVLIAMADCANHEGECYPSINTIADKCSVSRNFVIGAIKNLQEMDLILKKKRTHKNKRCTSNLYKILPDFIHKSYQQ